ASFVRLLGRDGLYQKLEELQGLRSAPFRFHEEFRAPAGVPSKEPRATGDGYEDFDFRQMSAMRDRGRETLG
ncbi:hypothetical protein, partial [Mesorhizobium sp. 98Argb]